MDFRRTSTVITIVIAKKQKNVVTIVHNIIILGYKHIMIIMKR